MHTPSLAKFVLTGLVASSTVASFELPSTALTRVGSLVALAAPAWGLPALETRHHQGKKAKKTTKREEEEDVELETRDLTTRARRPRRPTKFDNANFNAFPYLDKLCAMSPLVVML
ncbi:hypothetical protein GQ53DRAFT_78490 [Thozetella sp. PMI_491]|nr:hypothetical protein GQ53DRAFT_78490 [Thozetella sp. PMI_491]